MQPSLPTASNGPKVAVLNFGGEDFQSFSDFLTESGAAVLITTSPQELLAATGLAIRGEGAFPDVMDGVNQLNLSGIIDKRLTRGKSVLGIGTGMHVMFERQLESEVKGLGQWPGVFERLISAPLPHVGMAQVEGDSNSILLRGMPAEEFYFDHTFAVNNWELDIRPPFQPAAISYVTYGERFLAAVENGPLCAIQFHPEKSGPAGLQLLKNWVASL